MKTRKLEVTFTPPTEYKPDFAYDEYVDNELTESTEHGLVTWDA